jgi:exosome complex component RRP42
LDYRHFAVETDVLPSASGSARIRLDNTDILVAVKAEIVEPDESTPDQGKIQVNVECSSSMAMHLDNSTTQAMNVRFSNQLMTLLNDSGAVNLNDLCLIPGKQVWVLYIDALIQDSDGNLLDALSFAIKAALRNTKIPAVTVIQGDTPEEVELELSDDPCDVISLASWDHKLPVFVSIVKIGSAFIVDATDAEEQCLSAKLCVAVNPQGVICSTTKTGPGSISPTTALEMIRTAKSIGLFVIRKLNSTLSQSQSNKVGSIALKGGVGSGKSGQSQGKVEMDDTDSSAFGGMGMGMQDDSE